jgi:choline dehydrogenase-like flavoprotein
MTRISDPIQEGLARGWQVHGGAHGALPAEASFDVAIVGSGAGGGITAELLAQSGLSVVIVEAGPLRSSSDFRQLEREAYAELYQEANARKTADKAIAILQGRCVGGSTTVNWTSSFRTPPATLDHWRSHYGLDSFSEAELAPWFHSVEQRLHMAPWSAAPNENNALLARGARALGLSFGTIARNVNGCWNLGSCGLGCPVNAKQSMLITTLPAALDRGAHLYVETQVTRLVLAAGRVRHLECVSVRPDGSAKGATARVRARHYVVSGGAINTPALLLQSKLPDPHGLLGRRTFLHPVVLSSATHAQRVEGWAGAPQSIYSDHFLDQAPFDGPMGFKLEAPPLHPLVFATATVGFGQEHAQRMALFPHTQAVLALLRDGFHPDSLGGSVGLTSDGSPLLDYPLTPYVLEGARGALLAMAELQFAAGARTVLVGHELASPCSSWSEARRQIERLPMQPLLAKFFSAHVMGGCPMAADESRGVVRPDGVHWHVENLSVHYASPFPTTMCSNPQLSIYGIVNSMATALAKRLSGRDVALLSA